MIINGWEVQTFLLYITLAILISYLAKLSIVAKNENQNITIGKLNIKVKYMYYFAIYLIFIIFSVFRVINDNMGGTDSLTYIKHFNEMKYVKFFTLSNLKFNDFEYFYYNLMYLVKILGGNFHCFEFIIYSLIITSYLYIIDKEFDNSKTSWFIVLFFIPLLKSLNITRNCFAAAIGFVAINKLKDNKMLTAILIMIVAYLSHYIAIILLMFLLFYKYFPEKYVNKKSALLLPIINFFISELGLPIIKFLMKNSGFANYLNRIQISLWGYIPIIIMYLLIFLDDDFCKYIMKKKHYIYYKTQLFMMCFLPPAILINVAYRLMLFFEIPKYIIYADLYLYYRENKIKNKKIFDLIIIFLLIGWLAFKIYRLNNSSGLVIYRNYLFGGK